MESLGATTVTSDVTSRVSVSDNQFKGRTPPHCGAQEGHLSVVKHLCEKLRVKNPGDVHNHTPLHLAASYGHLDIVKYLVQFLDDKHPKSGAYWGCRTPLDLAKQTGYTAIVQYLQNL